MNPSDLQPVPPSEPDPAANTAGTPLAMSPGSGVQVRDARSRGVRTWLIALTVGLVVGMIAWAIGEATFAEESKSAGPKGSNTILSLAADNIRVAVVTSGVFGAVVGLCAGLAGGVIRRSVLWSILAATIGLVLGGWAGYDIATRLVPAYYEHAVENDLTHTLIVHGGIWAGSGAVAGLALAIGLGGGLGRMLRLVFLCAGAAVLAAFIFDFLGATIFPLAMTDRPVSQTWETRLLARLLLTMFVAIAAVLAMDPMTKARSTGGSGV